MKRAVLMVLFAGIGGCLGDEGPPNPVPEAQTEIPPPAVPGEQRRSIDWRNPMGGPAGNLLVDGDFENSIVIEGSQPQSGWFAFTNGPVYIHGETGGSCRSGLRCAVLEPGILLYGRGTAAKNSGMVAALWTKPPAGRNCHTVQANVVTCGGGVFLVTLSPEAPDPAEDGWCSYRTHLGRQSGAVCIAVQSTLATGEKAIVDAASIVPDTGTSPLAHESAPPPTQAEKDQVAAASRWWRSRIKLGAPLEDRPEIGPR